MPRFVLLRHECPPTMGLASHWDLMLERGDVLLTWRLETLPAAWQKQIGSPNTGAGQPAGDECVGAIRLAEHRLAYLDYEGAVSADRGEVRRIDRGDYRLLEESDALLCVDLKGAAIGGSLRLRNIAGDRWTLLAGDPL